MEVTTERFIRKPLYVDAVRVTSQNFEAIAAWCDGEVQKETEGPRAGKSYIRVRVQYPKSPRQSKAFIGDWVLYTETGYKVYTNPSFRKSFDDAPVEKKDASEERPATAEEIREKLPHAQDRRPKPPAVTEEPGVDLGITPQGEPIEVVAATPQAIADVVNEQQPVDDENLRQEVTKQAQVEVETSMTSAETLVDSPERSTPLVQDHTPVSGLGEAPTPEADAAGGPQSRVERNAAAKSEVVPQPEPVSEQPPEGAAAGKRILSEEEQTQMGPVAVREMLQTGDVVLAQDLAA